MKSLVVLALSLIVFSQGSFAQQNQHWITYEGVRVTKKSTFKVYGRNIEYIDLRELSKIDLDLKHEIRVPQDLLNAINSIQIGTMQEDVSGLRQFLEVPAKTLAERSQGKSLAYFLEALGEWTAISLNYEEVDKEGNPLRGANLQTLLKNKKGDCDKYAQLYLAMARLIQSNHFIPFKNVYVVNDHFGGQMENHAWIHVLILTPNKILVTGLDPTFANVRGTYVSSYLYPSVGNGLHISDSPEDFTARFYGPIFAQKILNADDRAPIMKQYFTLRFPDVIVDKLTDEFTPQILNWVMLDPKVSRLVKNQIERKILDDYPNSIVAQFVINTDATKRHENKRELGLFSHAMRLKERLDEEKDLDLKKQLLRIYEEVHKHFLSEFPDSDLREYF